MGVSYYAQCRSRPKICLKFAPILHLVDGSSSMGARRSADMEQPLEACGEVRWYGTFNRPPTPSTVGDMANRVVGRQRSPVPLFCAEAEMAKKKKGRGGPTSVQGVIPVFMYPVPDSGNDFQIARLCQTLDANSYVASTIV